jgi:hypothetical protein
MPVILQSCALLACNGNLPLLSSQCAQRDAKKHQHKASNAAAGVL